MRRANLFIITGLLIFSLSSIMSVYLYAQTLNSFHMPGYQDILYKASIPDAGISPKGEKLSDEYMVDWSRLLQGCSIESKLEETGRLYQIKRLTEMSI